MSNSPTSVCSPESSGTFRVSHCCSGSSPLVAGMNAFPPNDGSSSAAAPPQTSPIPLRAVSVSSSVSPHGYTKSVAYVGRPVASRGAAS